MDNLNKYEDMLKIEREKLTKLILKALNAPISKNGEVIIQSRKVDKILDRIQKEKAKG